MTVPASSLLEVRGARLYYETYGSGPVVVMVPGAAGCAEPYRMLLAQLAASNTVVAYDRRGFSRSSLVADQDYDHRLDTDADDVAALIGHISDGPALVFGNSSGAIVALHLLTRHPSLVRRVIAHEPPVMTELVDGPEWMEFFTSVYDLYRQTGPGPAMDRFAERSFPESDRQTMAHAPENEFTRSNSKYWFEHELRQYPAAVLDYARLRRHADQVILAVGRESGGFPCREATVALDQRLGREVIELPGGHLGFIAHVKPFASALSTYLHPSSVSDGETSK